MKTNKKGWAVEISKNYKHVTFVLYDSINNSVFHSQVLRPILNFLESRPDAHVSLVSFEQSSIVSLGKFDTKKIIELVPAHDRLHFVLAKKLPFFGNPSLWPAVWQLKRLLRYLNPDHVVARGPLAGWIAIKSRCDDLTVQARGLLAEEHRMVHKKKRRFIRSRYEKIEHEVYEPRGNVKIEAVSPALKAHLIKLYKTNPERITIATHDIPDKYKKEQVADWRKQMRSKLGLKDDYFVYCYNGSAHEWQCVDEMTDYFVEQRKRNKKSFFLVLSKERDVFAQKFIGARVPKDSYKVLSVHPGQTQKYLSAADAGLLFRKSDPVNWVARPTKVLEYEAVGLKVIHNNTVAWLTQESQK
ncbi:hypothetical protein KAT92_03885 [Candidatus Babeliales bacterium]|nr:hypothetical protein [Candidatus Babeliales bacterium]